MPITFTRVDLPHGWMGNMAPFPVKYHGIEWRTTEALFQALRFDDDGIREAIRGNKSPMGCKMAARSEKAEMVVIPQSEQDVANMEMVLRLKLDQHPDLQQQLLDTGDDTIIEDSTRHPHGSAKFWGAVRKKGKWIGENILGKMWMKLREELKGNAPPSANGDALMTILKVKSLAAEVGGMKSLKALVEALSE